MPWKERSVMDERMRFVIRLKDGESMASVCREYGISRPTGYKIFERAMKSVGSKGICGDLALASTRSRNGTVTSEVARRQKDGTWLWVIDRYSVSW